MWAGQERFTLKNIKSFWRTGMLEQNISYSPRPHQCNQWLLPWKLTGSSYRPFKPNTGWMKKMRMIIKVNPPTEWVTAHLRSWKAQNKESSSDCLDPERTFSDSYSWQYSHKTNRSIDFLKCNANHGYWQIQLDEESKLLPYSTLYLGVTVSWECIKSA